MTMKTQIVQFLYLLAAIGFILSIRGLSSARTSIWGNRLGVAAMITAIGATLWGFDLFDKTIVWIALGIGAVIGIGLSQTISMTALPQLVAGFHSLVGLAAVCVAVSAFYDPDGYGLLDNGSLKAASALEMGLGCIVGAMTFTGSIIAFMKLQGILKGKPLRFSGQHLLNILLAILSLFFLVHFVMFQSSLGFWGLLSLGTLLGVLLIVPIGGADMPVIVSMLNSYSGWAAAGIGFTLQNSALIIVGALVGSSGAILSYIMCKAMNRSFWSVVFGGIGGEVGSGATSGNIERSVKSGSAEDAAFILQNAQSVIIVPGYGMAVAQSQHALREMADRLKSEGVQVRYAIHPVAGRMPGHMNVLLAEANVPYEEVCELEDINNDFAQTDVAFVIGANDVTNPAAKTDPTSPIYGMPILEVEKAKTVLFVKRSMASGYAGVENEVFYRDNTMMLFGDAKKVCEEIIKSLHQ